MLRFFLLAAGGLIPRYWITDLTHLMGMEELSILLQDIFHKSISNWSSLITFLHSRHFYTYFFSLIPIWWCLDSGGPFSSSTTCPIPKVFSRGWGQGSVQTTWVFPHQTRWEDLSHNQHCNSSRRCSIGLASRLFWRSNHVFMDCRQSQPLRSKPSTSETTVTTRLEEHNCPTVAPQNRLPVFIPGSIPFKAILSPAEARAAPSDRSVTAVTSVKGERQE